MCTVFVHRQAHRYTDTTKHYNPQNYSKLLGTNQFQTRDTYELPHKKADMYVKTGQTDATIVDNISDSSRLINRAAYL